jgi:hypothetical protein
MPIGEATERSCEGCSICHDPRALPALRAVIALARRIGIAAAAQALPTALLCCSGVRATFELSYLLSVCPRAVIRSRTDSRLGYSAGTASVMPKRYQKPWLSGSEEQGK